jgi:pimeloyl-ACP methyl ester carboxylesterase
MIEVPRTLYAKSGDLHLAYHVLGDRPLDLLVLPSGNISIDSIEEEPSFARFHRRLASFSRLVRFDPRGVGLSDPASPSSPPTLEEWMRDALAVMDAAGIERAAVLAEGPRAMVAILLAATHPDRVSSLVVVNGTARALWAPDYPMGLRPE